MKHIEKNIYFRDVYFFSKRCSDIVIVKDNQLMRNNLFICFRKLPLQEYISKIITNVKNLNKICFKYTTLIDKII